MSTTITDESLWIFQKDTNLQKMYWINPQSRLLFLENEFSLLVFQWNHIISVFLFSVLSHSAVSWTLHWTNGNAFLFILLLLKLSHLVNCLISHHIQYIFIRIFNSTFSTHWMKRKLFHSVFVQVNETCVGYDLTNQSLTLHHVGKLKRIYDGFNAEKKIFLRIYFKCHNSLFSVEEENFHNFSLSTFQFIAISQKLVYSVFT